MDCVDDYHSLDESIEEFVDLRQRYGLMTSKLQDRLVNSTIYDDLSRVLLEDVQYVVKDIDRDMLCIVDRLRRFQNLEASTAMRMKLCNGGGIYD